MSNESSRSDSLKRRRVIQGLGGAGLAGLAGCSGGGGGGGDDGGGGETQSGGGTADGGGSGGSRLRLAQEKSPVEFDPIVLNDVPSTEVVDRIVEGLYAYDETTGVVPLLAEGEPEVSNGGARYVVELKDGPTFSNGDPVTPEDVIYSFNAPVEEETENASELNMIESMEAVDDRTVRFDLKYPYGAFMDTLTWYVVPKSVREADKQTFNKEPIGSGPFVFEEWQEGNFTRLSRNEDYWGDPQPQLDEIELVPITEATTRVTTLKNGENDVIKTIPPKQYPTVESMQDVNVNEVPGMGYFYLAFNCKEGPTANRKVREAVDYTFSMDQAVSNYVEPTGVRQYSPLPEAVASDWGMPVEEWEQIPRDKNVERAKQLFDEAGVQKNYSWKILVPPDQKRKQIGISVSNGLKEAGFGNVQVQQLDWGQFLEQYNTGNESDYNMYTLGWSGTPDPDAFTYYLLGRTEDVLGVNNGTYYGANSERGKRAAQKFADARESTNRDERKRLYVEGITTALEDRAHIPAYNLKNAFGVKNYVEDFLAHPVDSFHVSTDHNNVSIQQ